jgi:hypothetical protein
MYSKEDFESELESRLNELYHQKIVPLEKEIIKLGGNLDSEGNQNNIDLQLGRFLPKNPFIEDRENIHFWEDENSDYYKFFKSLFEECLEKEWIKIKKPHYTYEETFIYWMWVFGCFNHIDKKFNIVVNIDDENHVSPIEWFGQNNICVYLIVSLENRYISTTKRNKLIENHFLPNSDRNTIANTKSKLKYKKPSKSSEIDELLFELTSRLEG